MKMILMGTGTSHGVPVIGCSCKVCNSPHKEDKRYRCSAYICGEDAKVLIDCGPEFRIQALENKISHLDAVLMTHSHADHAHGLDDLRIFSHTRPDMGNDVNGNKIYSGDTKFNYPMETAGPGLPIYGNETTINDLTNRFDYVFHHKYLGGGLPKLNLVKCTEISGENPIRVGSLEMIPVPMMHGRLESSGWIISENLNGEKKSICYLTDCNYISEESLEIIKNYGGKIVHLIIDGLREQKHSTHCNFIQAMAYAEKICAEHTWITHINHDFFHSEIQNYIDSHLSEFPNLCEIKSKGGSVSPAFDHAELLT